MYIEYLYLLLTHLTAFKRQHRAVGLWHHIDMAGKSETNISQYDNLSCGRYDNLRNLLTFLTGILTMSGHG